MSAIPRWLLEGRDPDRIELLNLHSSVAFREELRKLQQDQQLLQRLLQWLQTQGLVTCEWCIGPDQTEPNDYWLTRNPIAVSPPVKSATSIEVAIDQHLTYMGIK